MRRLALAALAAAALAAGCGSDDGANGAGEPDRRAFDAAFAKVNERLLDVGRDFTPIATGEADRPLPELAAGYTRLAEGLEAVRAGLGALEPPSDEAADVKALDRKAGEIARDARGVAAAARREDAPAITRRSLEVFAGSEDLNEIQNRLAAATGADRGDK